MGKSIILKSTSNIQYVTINNTSIVSADGRNADIPVFGSGTKGVLEEVAGYGTGSIALADGVKGLGLSTPSDANITDRKARGTNGFGAITTASYDKAVKAALCDGSGPAYTSTEQAAARTRLNAQANVNYIELSGTDGATGTLNDEQIAILTASELNYIWLNNMHRLDFQYRDNGNNKATYASADLSTDGAKSHAIEINLSSKAFRVYHKNLVILPDLPTAAGDYSLKVNIDASENATYSWA